MQNEKLGGSIRQLPLFALERRICYVQGMKSFLFLIFFLWDIFIDICDILFVPILEGSFSAELYFMCQKRDIFLIIVHFCRFKFPFRLLMLISYSNERITFAYSNCIILMLYSVL